MSADRNESMEISERYDEDSNGQGNRRWHVRDINGKKFLFSQESECGRRLSDNVDVIDRKVSVHAWVTDKPTEVFITGELKSTPEGGVDWDNSPTEWITRTGWDVHPLREFESITKL